MKGSTFKRCTCPATYNAKGKRLNCPKKHGSWSFIADTGVDQVTGAAYVDWAGMVGYWTGQLGEDSWASLYGPTEKQIQALTDDPILIVETGAEQGPQKAAWTTAMLAGLAADPRVVGMVYFDYGTAQGKRADWTLEDDPAALTAYRTGAARLHVAELP